MNTYQDKARHEAARNLRVTIQQQAEQLEQVVMTLFQDAQSDKGTWGHTGSMESIVSDLQGILDRFPATVYAPEWQVVMGSVCESYTEAEQVLEAGRRC
jgi:hypothetical protein